jgi:hypothetical protein
VEYGRNAGGQIQLITRSGTNQYHGNAFDYLRNRDFNANDFFDNAAGAPKPVLIQNNYGGSFGGPIKKNKIFYFGNYQGIRTHAQGVQNTTVPTVTAKEGIFEWQPASGPVQQYNIVTNDPLHKGIDPTVASLLSLFPAPSNNNVGDGLNSAGYQFNFANNSLSDQFTIKVDYNLSDKIHFFERTSWQRNTAIDSLNGAQNVNPGEAPGTQGGKRWGVAGAWIGRSRTRWSTNSATATKAHRWISIAPNAKMARNSALTPSPRRFSPCSHRSQLPSKRTPTTSRKCVVTIPLSSADSFALPMSTASTTRESIPTYR